jgi:ribosomal protein L30/L7E
MLGLRLPHSVCRGSNVCGLPRVRSILGCCPVQLKRAQHGAGVCHLRGSLHALDMAFDTMLALRLLTYSHIYIVPTSPALHS